jgi:peptidoglycan/LPS O-acetylase OafA/YrhL
MPLTAYLAALAVLLAATGTAAGLTRLAGAPSTAGRYVTIDGLRGYLALLVFLHHAAVWYFYRTNGTWTVPPSNLFTLFGQGGVALFFMITAFLFFGRLLDARQVVPDWNRLYVSRVFRLVPLYALAMAALLAIVGWRSGWQAREPASTLLGNVAAWLAFTVPGQPDVNGVKDTWRIVAGATWSLPYEWFFYLALPILGIAVGVRPSTPYLLLGLAAAIVVAAGVWRPGVMQALYFVGGMVAALAIRMPRFRTFAGTTAAGLLAVACLAATVAMCATAYSLPAVFLLTVAFCLIAGGCSLFGVLATPMARLLGDIAYSVYLLHGIVLFLLFAGPFPMRMPTPMTHWLVVVGLAPVLVILCYATFRCIERPAMKTAPRVADWLARRRSRTDTEEENIRPLPLS